MPDDLRSWAPFHVPASMANSEQLDAFLHVVYDYDDAWGWVNDGDVEVSDLLAAMRLCGYFQFDDLEERCVEELSERLTGEYDGELRLVVLEIDVTTELVEVWQFLAGIKNGDLRRLAAKVTAQCLEHNYAAAKAKLVAADV